MTRPLIALVCASIVILSGCGPIPKTAKEFRDSFSSSGGAKESETFVVARPFRQVSDAFQRQADECLNVTVNSQVWHGQRLIASANAYRATVNTDAAGTELIVQMRVSNDFIYDVPEGGWYLLIADAIPMSPTSTKVVIYPPDSGHEALVNAVRGWAAGTTSGCPAL